MIIELIQSDYYEEQGKTNFAKDLREDNNEDFNWHPEYVFSLNVGNGQSYVGIVGGNIGGGSSGWYDAYDAVGDEIIESNIGGGTDGCSNGNNVGGGTDGCSNGNNVGGVNLDTL